jgi:hypothetical protein
VQELFFMLASRSLPVAVLSLALLAGCGDSDNPRAAVQGSISYDGQPVDEGGIVFIPVGGGPGGQAVRATGDIKDGKYELNRRQGPMPGKHRVEIYWRKKTGKKVPGEGGHPKDEVVQAIPSKYNTSSTLTRDVESGRNTFDFELAK